MIQSYFTDAIDLDESVPVQGDMGERNPVWVSYDCKLIKAQKLVPNSAGSMQTANMIALMDPDLWEVVKEGQKVRYNAGLFVVVGKRERSSFNPFTLEVYLQ